MDKTDKNTHSDDPAKPSRIRRSTDNASIERLRFAKNFREAREAIDLTQANIETRSGVKRPTISDIERGRHNPSVDLMSKLAHAVGKPLHELLQSNRVSEK